MLNHRKIRTLREGKGLTQEQAAKQADKSWIVQTWSRLESGTLKNPTLDTLEKIARVLGCGIDDLVK